MTVKIYVLNYDFRKRERENNEHLTAKLITRLAATGGFLMHQVFVDISDGSVYSLVFWRGSTQIQLIFLPLTRFFSNFLACLTYCEYIAESKMYQE